MTDLTIKEYLDASRKSEAARPIYGENLNIEWLSVLEAGDCEACDCCGEPWCPRCEEHYTLCSCPGPHQSDEYEYKDIKGVLHARRL